jgi:ankyrin repeat protein
MISNRVESDLQRCFGWSAGRVFCVGWVVICLVLTAGARSAAPGDEIHKAVIKGDLNRVVALLKDHPELLESKNNMGQTPLLAAVAHNQLEIAELLLANGAVVNARDGYGHTPLMQALWVYNHDKMVRLLLAKEADVNLEDKWKMTALAYAAKQGQMEDAKILLANDANVNVVTGSSPLYLAVIGTHTEMVELLLANGADVNYRMGGFTALHFAKQDNYLVNQISDPKIEALIKKYGGRE